MDMKSKVFVVCLLFLVFNSFLYLHKSNLDLVMAFMTKHEKSK